MSEHAKLNLEKYARMIKGEKVKMLLALISSAKNRHGSTACIVRLDTAIKNPYREDWKANDVLAAIIRHGQVVTVMLTRTSQCRTNHFRTDRIAKIQGQFS